MDSIPIPDYVVSTHRSRGTDASYGDLTHVKQRLAPCLGDYGSSSFRVYKRKGEEYVHVFNEEMAKYYTGTKEERKKAIYKYIVEV